MRDKIQGEGDYEAARRFNRQERDFVERKYGKRNGQHSKHEKGRVTAVFDLERLDQERLDEEQLDQQNASAGEQEAIERDDEAYLQRQGIDVPRPRN